MSSRSSTARDIKILPDNLSSRIAAGEVVERPASAVKELVENSLDAGASRVEVSVKDGGRTEISVVDNGHGIPADQIRLAFERFATSKIDESSELIGIPTLGFRGEALPSIASVAQVSLVSRPPDQESGVSITLHYGDIRDSGPTGVPLGTTFTVRNLFANVPARLRFMASAGAELSRVSAVLSAYALLRPDVAFTLISNDSQRFATPGNGSIPDASASIHGAEIASALLPVTSIPAKPGQTSFGVEGFASAPAFSRGNRNYITIGVNGRWIQSRRLSFAIEQAYHGLMKERRFPIAVIRLSAPPGDVDVNIHPAKTEVRFLREQAVFGEIQKAVRAAIVDLAPVPEISPPGQAWSRQSMPNRPPAGAPTNPLWPDPLEGSPLAESRTVATGDAGHPDTLEPFPPTMETSPGETPHEALPVLRLLGQARETYLIAEGPEGVYLIDQHAAHERVIFEQISDRIVEGEAESQQLLSPETVGLQPGQEETLATHADEVRSIGFVLEDFGSHAVLIRAVPRVLGQKTPTNALIDLLDGVSEGASASTWQHRLIATLACHSSITAGRTVADEEARALLRQLEQTREPHTCPHGRPTMIHMSTGALDRQFGRR